jgi:hypothetical protein
VLYFYGGEERHSDFRGALDQALAAAPQGMVLRMDEIDLIKQPGFDIRNGEVQNLYMHSIISGKWDLVLISPPTSGFSRTAFSNLQSSYRIGTRNGPKVTLG